MEISAAENEIERLRCNLEVEQEISASLRQRMSDLEKTLEQERNASIQRKRALQSISDDLTGVLIRVPEWEPHEVYAAAHRARVRISFFLHEESDAEGTATP